MSLEAIEKILNPYIHRKYRKRLWWPKVKSLIKRVYPQADGGIVLEIRIHESDLVAARNELAKLKGDVKEGGE